MNIRTGLKLLTTHSCGRKANLDYKGYPPSTLFAHHAYEAVPKGAAEKWTLK